ncbi:transporter substrate-binding domain-containing protein, partial [Methylobacterium sp. WL103]|uniref:transporter substrate-binding domain-containing protein n=1 Tax=Methylobacterium sp. WL103 TaxID=2603891 RepID=UPI0011C8CD35
PPPPPPPPPFFFPPPPRQRPTPPGPWGGLGDYHHVLPKAEAKPFSDLASAEGAVKRGEADYVFADGLGLALWVGGLEAGNCCALTGGDYLENRYFGEGIGLITRQEDAALSRALDDALQRVWDDGKYTELYLRFFPVSPF